MNPKILMSVPNKVRFNLEPGDMREMEILSCLPVDETTWAVAEIPFYALGVALHDHVQIDEVRGEMTFSKVLKRNGQVTLRVLLLRNLSPLENATFFAFMHAAGANVQRWVRRRYIAISVDQAGKKPVVQFLHNWQARQLLSFEVTANPDEPLQETPS